MIAVLNIGLKIQGIYSPENEQKFLSYIPNVLRSRVDLGQYVGESEPTLIVEVEVQGALLGLLVAALVIDCEQECIAVKYEDKGKLLYSLDFKGEKFEYNEQYFINI